MANIFTRAVKFLGTTLKQVATNDTLKDFKHANKLFVGGGSYRLSPKNAFLFHVFIDVNDSLASRALSGRTRKIEIGLMAKTADLPKFSYEIKKYNAYNRVNLVQSKISYDDLSFTFHDDNANVIRNFYYDYFRYYFRDSDYGTETYRIPNKYSEQTIGSFGFTRRKESHENFIRAIRIYSLHQKRFSEYILINPLIKTFRHGNHVNSGDPNTLESTMSIVYENVLYQDGVISQVSPDGFASLEYYDTSYSPLRTAGGVKSIFGTGGLLDTAGSILGDIQNQNFLSAAFKAARAINTARGMNIKKALVSELTGIYTAEASRAVIGAIENSMSPINRNGVQVTTVGGIEGAVSNRYTGIQDLTSVAALAGAAVLLNSTPITNRYKANPTIQSTPFKPSTYNPRLPLNPGVAATASPPTNFNTLNDQTNAATNQGVINRERRIADINLSIAGLNKTISSLGLQASDAQKQINTTQTIISDLNTKITTTAALTVPGGVDPVQWASDRDRLLAQYRQELRTITALNSIATTTYTNKVAEITKNQTTLNQLIAERNRYGQ